MPDSPTWLEALHDAVLSSDAESLSAPEPTVTSGEFVAARRCLELLESLRRLNGPPHPSSSQVSEKALGGESHTYTASDDHEPQRIGRFEINRELGSGGHGIVFLAFDPLLRRNVALKVPRPEAVSSPELRRRFVSEARAAAQLSHPNIVAVHEVGYIGPVCFIAAEYCPGPTLAEWLGANRIGQRGSIFAHFRAAELVALLADGVSHAHGHGVLHRDLKPSNVLLTPIDDSSGDVRPPGAGSLVELLPRLTDFGLAKLDDTAAEHTRTGALLGTPAYMAPEQAEGRTRDISVRSDVYGLGAVLYELLAGRAPFAGGTPLDTIRRVLAEDPVPPSRLVAKVPADLEAICLKCLEKNPDRRYASMAELAADLRRFLHREPTRARPLNWHQRVGKWSRRRPLVASLSAVLLLATMVLASVVAIYTVQLRNALADAEARRAEADAERVKAVRQREIVQIAERATRDSELETRRLMYASDIRLADEAYRRNNPGEAAELLARYLPREGEEDLREFGWRYLWQRCHKVLITLRGHSGAVFWAGFSHDGALVATSGEDGTIRLWSAGDGGLIQTLKGHSGDVNCLSFSHDDKQLASCGADGTARIWDIATGREIRSIAASTQELFAVVFSPSNRWLATAGKDQQVRIWSAAKGQLHATLAKHVDFVQSLSFSPDERSLVSCGDDGLAYVWDLETSTTRLNLSGNCGDVYAVDFSPKGSQIAAGGQNGQVIVWNSTTGQELRRFKGHATRVTSIKFSVDGRRLLTAGRDQAARIWDSLSGDLLASFDGHAERLWHAEWSPDGASLVTASSDGTAKMGKLSEPHEVLHQYLIDRGQMVLNHRNELCAVSRENPDAQTLVVHRDREFQRRAPPHGSTVLGTALDPTGASAVGYDVAGSIHLSRELQPWRPTAGSMLINEYARVAVSPGGRHLAFGVREIVIFDLDAFSRVAEIPLPSALAWLRYSGDGHWLAGGTLDGAAFVWDAKTRQQHRAWKRISLSPPIDGAISFDGRWIVVGSEDGHVRVLQTDQDVERYDLAGNRPRQPSVAISPDNVNCAAAGTNVWDLRTGRKLLSLADFGCAGHALSQEELVGVLPDAKIIRWTAPFGDRSINRCAPADVTMEPQFAPAGQRDLELRAQRVLPLGQPPRVTAASDAFARFTLLGGLRQIEIRPTFDDREDDNGLQLGALVLKRTRFIVDAYSKNNDPRDIAGLTRDADQHTQLTHKTAGYPYLYLSRLSGIMLLESGTFERFDVPASELGEIDLDMDRFREAHRWAKRHGYAGGFPTFRDSVGGEEPQYGVIAIKPEFAEEVFLPAVTVWQEGRTSGE